MYLVEAVVKATLSREVISKIKTGEGSSSIKPLQTCWYPLTGKVRKKVL